MYGLCLDPACLYSVCILSARGGLGPDSVPEACRYILTDIQTDGADEQTVSDAPTHMGRRTDRLGSICLWVLYACRDSKFAGVRPRNGNNKKADRQTGRPAYIQTDYTLPATMQFPFINRLDGDRAHKWPPERGIRPTTTFWSQTLTVCLSVCLSGCLPVWLSVCLSVWLAVCLSGCLSVFLSVCLSVCLWGCLGTHL